MTVQSGLVLVAVMLAVEALAGVQAPVFRSSVDLVAVDVSVRRDGRPVPGLGATDFAVVDNGRTQSLTDVSYESAPIEITVLADSSSSVDGPLLASLKRAIDRIGAALRPSDRVHIVGFNESITEKPVDAERRGALSSLLAPPSGATSLFDALVAASVRPVEAGYRQMIVVFTDGRDTMSFVDEKTVTAVARASGATIFVVAATEDATPMRSGARVPHEALFTAIAEATGGVLAVLPRSDELGPAFVRAFDEFRSSYVLRYAPDGVSQSGWHDIVVRVTRPGRFDVRARRGYLVDRLPLQSSP